MTDEAGTGRALLCPSHPVCIPLSVLLYALSPWHPGFLAGKSHSVMGYTGHGPDLWSWPGVSRIDHCHHEWMMGGPLFSWGVPRPPRPPPSGCFVPGGVGQFEGDSRMEPGFIPPIPAVGGMCHVYSASYPLEHWLTFAVN